MIDEDDEYGVTFMVGMGDNFPMVGKTKFTGYSQLFQFYTL